MNGEDILLLLFLLCYCVSSPSSFPPISLPPCAARRSFTDKVTQHLALLLFSATQPSFFGGRSAPFLLSYFLVVAYDENSFQLHTVCCHSSKRKVVSHLPIRSIATHSPIYGSSEIEICVISDDRRWSADLVGV